MKIVKVYAITIEDVFEYPGRTPETIRCYEEKLYSLEQAERSFLAEIGEDVVDNGYVLQEGSTSDPTKLGLYRKVTALKRMSIRGVTVLRTYSLTIQETLAGDAV